MEFTDKAEELKSEALYESEKHHPATVLGISLGLIALCTFIGTGLLMLLGKAWGYDLQEMSALAAGLVPDASKSLIKAMVTVNQISTFMVPSIIIGLICYKRKWLRFLYLNKSPLARNCLLAVLIPLSSYPLVQLSFWINQQIPLPELFSEMENATQALLDIMLTIDSPFDMVINVLIIAVVPALGEELIFRGILQKNLQWLASDILGNKALGGHLAVWTAAFIFSAIHMQFEGFFPRMLLGAVLGYLFYFTNNLWIPIIAHFFNNALTLVVQTYFKDSVSSFDVESTELAPWWATLIFTVVLVYLFSILVKRAKEPIDGHPPIA